MSLRNTGLVHGVHGGQGTDNFSAAGGGGQSKPHKHLDLMSLTAVRRVVDLSDESMPESRDCFTLICRTNQVG